MTRALLPLLALAACGPRSTPVPVPVPLPEATPDATPDAAPVITPSTPVVIVDAAPPPPASTCTHVNPPSCPAEEPNVNGLCTTKGQECSYGGGCCPSPVYVCVKQKNKQLRFEARFYKCE